MKKILFLIVCAFALFSCGKKEDPSVGDGKVELSVSDFVDVDGILGGAKSSITTGSGGFVFNWDDKDRIGIFPEIGEQTQQLLISVEAAKQMQSEDTYSGDLLGWQLNPDVKYSAYFPFKSDYDQTPKNIGVSYAGQRQEGNSSMTGLGAFDFLTTQPVGRDGNVNNSVTFKFQHIGALVRFRKQVKLDGTFTRLTVTNGKTGTYANVFPTDANVNLFGTPQVTYPTKSNTFSVELDDFTVDAQGYANVWCMFPPVDLSGQTLTVTLKGAEGTADVTFKVPGRKLEGGNAYSFNKNLPVLPEGALSGEFSLASGKKIVFSKGNLWADKSDSANPKWYFENNQYEYRTFSLKDAHYYENGTLFTQTQSNHIGLIGWSTDNTKGQWGLNIELTSVNDYRGNFVDWGNNPIINGGNDSSVGWKTMSQNEWYYLIKSRTDASSKAKKSKVDGIGGLVLLPDDLSTSIANSYTEEQWKEMEKAGAVFLPAAGVRDGNSYRDTDLSIEGKNGSYWTSTKSGTDEAYRYYFALDLDELYNQGVPKRHRGYCVRLVHEIDE